MNLLHPLIGSVVTGAVALVALFLLLIWWWRRGRPTRVELPSPFADVPVTQIEVGSWSWRYHKSGRGPYMVLIHGIGANLFCWRYILPYLAKRYTLVAVDLPGFGQSSKPVDARYGLDEQTERLRDLLKALGIRQTYLVGNSMGGNIALWFAHRYPDQVLGTAVIAPATSPKLLPLSAARLAWLAKPLSRLVTKRAMRWAHRRTVSKKDLVLDDRIDETFRTYGQNSEAVRSFLLATEVIRDPRLAQSLSQLKSRVLVLWGSRDLLVNRQVIDDLESKLQAHESLVHVGGGHHLQEDEPEWVAEKIDAFFSPKPRLSL